MAKIKNTVIIKHHTKIEPVIIQRSDLRLHRCSPSRCSYRADYTKQGLDTSVFALLSSQDECGRVNDLPYSEDVVVNNYSDLMETDTMTPYENDYYQVLGENAVENAQPTNNQSFTTETIQPTDNQSVTTSQPE